MRSPFVRRARYDAALAEADALRTALAVLGRQLHRARGGDTVPMPAPGRIEAMAARREADRRRLARHPGPRRSGTPIQGPDEPAYFEADPADTVPMPRYRSGPPPGTGAARAGDETRPSARRPW